MGLKTAFLRVFWGGAALHTATRAKGLWQGHAHPTFQPPLSPQLTGGALRPTPTPNTPPLTREHCRSEVHLAHTQVWHQRGEGVVGDLGARRSEDGQQGGLAFGGLGVGGWGRLGGSKMWGWWNKQLLGLWGGLGQGKSLVLRFEGVVWVVGGCWTWGGVINSSLARGSMGVVSLRAGVGCWGGGTEALGEESWGAVCRFGGLLGGCGLCAGLGLVGFGGVGCGWLQANPPNTPDPKQPQTPLNTRPWRVDKV